MKRLWNEKIKRRAALPLLLVVTVIQGAGWIGLSQTLAVRPAIEVEVPPGSGIAYQLTQSSDFSRWEPYGAQIFAQSNTVSLLLPARETAKFFRLESFPVRDMSSMLERIRSARGVPALACAVVSSNRIVATGAVGMRKHGTNVPVRLQDQWHIGSIAKSMTATLAAMMVEQGMIQWTNTLADVFPDLAPNMNSRWRNATLEQLTSNRGGAPENLPSALWSELQNFGGPPRDARRLLLTRLTSTAPSSTPGTRYEYSNAGFALAGHMLETVGNESWEQLIQERLFAPLGLASAGFGAPGTPRYLDQPLGHSLPNPDTPPSAANRVVSIMPSATADNPPAIAPAGTVHCSLADLARYAAFHLTVHQRDTAILSQKSGMKLHTAYPDNAGYAHGWIAYDNPFASGKALFHSGSNTYWWAQLWLAPERDFAMMVFCNLGGTAASNAANDVFNELSETYLGESAGE